MYTNRHVIPIYVSIQFEKMYNFQPTLYLSIYCMNKVSYKSFCKFYPAIHKETLYCVILSF